MSPSWTTPDGVYFLIGLTQLKEKLVWLGVLRTPNQTNKPSEIRNPILII